MAASAPAGVRRVLRVLEFRHLVPYAEGLALQEALFDARRTGASVDTLVLLQHKPVYTIGKRGQASDFKVPIEELHARGIETYHAPRGGQVTFHGPRQLVAYPVVDVRAAKFGARAFVESLEDCIIDTLGSVGIVGHGRVPGATGVWVGDRKIAAIGVKLSRGVSSHGLALNIDTDLSCYDAIVPCGISDKDVTSIAAEMHARQREARAGSGDAHAAAVGSSGARNDVESSSGSGCSMHVDSGDRAATSAAPPGRMNEGIGTAPGSPPLPPPRRPRRQGHVLASSADADALFADVRRALVASFERRLRYSSVRVERLCSEGPLREMVSALRAATAAAGTAHVFNAAGGTAA